MSRIASSFILLIATFFFAANSVAADKNLVYQGGAGPGEGKHIVFIASDHEYRSEEAVPAIARIMAKRYGFKCTVLFGLDKKGHIKTGSNNIPGIEALDNAVMLFLGVRFLTPNDQWMEHFENYLNAGKPVLGLRTTTHAFSNLKGKYKKYNYNYTGKDFTGGFGRQILGETWAGHYGHNHKCSTQLDIVSEQAKHIVLAGVKDMHTKAGAYSAAPMPNSVVLANCQVLTTMEQNSAPLTSKAPKPALWLRTYKSVSGKEGRVFCSTQGASEDIVNEGFRRAIINGVFWCMGLESYIRPNMNVDFVGPYNPTTFSFGRGVKNTFPLDILGWDTPIFKK